MAKYSRIHKAGKKSFRYNHEHAVLEWVCQPDAEMLADNREWQEKFGRDLWDIVDGYVVCGRIGLGRDSWKESPKYWCEQYAADIEAEVGYMVI